MSEATTIDTLSLEITSNSTGAAEGIDKLAVSLGKLKQNGNIGLAVKSLNNLSDALKKLTPVTSNANKLSALADSISRLSQAGSMARVINQLNKLPGAVKGLSDLKIDDSLAEKANGLAAAMIPLSNIKSGGLGTMVNALDRVSKVTDDLDGDTIARFADRVRELNVVLEPLSNKMTTIQAGFRGINSPARSAGYGVKEFGSKVNATTLNLASMITVIQGVVSTLMPLVRLLSGTISEALEWDGVAARFGRGFGSQASEVYDWVQRLNEEMGINTQQFMQYSSVFSTMLQGFGVSLKDSSKMAVGYTELVYDIWAGYNDIYKTFGDAADAVKSAIAGEVEPIRRAGFTIVESTLEQTAANHGLSISLENATEAQKSYLRYLTLVDQAHAQNLVGTYASELNTAEGLMRTFSQQCRSMAQALGSLFLPALVKVMPWIQAFIELLTSAIRAVAKFFGIAIQPVDWGSSIGGGVSGLEGVGDAADTAADSLGKTAGSAGKAKKAIEDLKRATIGIDELNVISPLDENSGSGGSGGIGGGVGGGLGAFEDLDVDSLWDESIFDQIQFQVDEIKARIKEALSSITAIVSGFMLAIGTILVVSGANIPLGLALMAAGAVGLVAVISENWDGMSVQLAKTLTTVTAVLGGFLLAIGAFLAFSGVSVGLGVALMAAGAVSLATAATINWKFLNGDMTNTLSILTGIVSGGLLAMGALFAFTGVSVGLGIALMVAGAVGLATTVGLNWNAMSEPLRKAIGTLEMIVGSAMLSFGAILALSGANVPLGIALMAAGAVSMVAAERLNWNSLNGEMKNRIATLTALVSGAALGVGAVLAFSGVATGVGIALIAAGAAGIIASASVNWSWITEKVKGVLKEIGIAAGGSLLALGVLLVCTGVGVPIGLALIAAGGASLVSGVALNWDSIVEKVKKALGRIETEWDKLVKKVKEFDFIEVSVSLIKKGWKTVKEWIGKIPTLSQLIKLGKSGWSTVRGWIGSIPAVSQAVKLAKSGWSSVKSWVGTVPVISAPIKLVKSGWSTIKGWLGSLSYKLSFTLPKIGINWGTKTFLGFKISYPKSFYTYAKGGFPDMGEMFIAREAGPEMVGKIGSKTTVANNQQIVEAVSEGVYSAVLTAMKQSESNGSQSVNVYLDGRQITSAVEKRQRERGTSLVGKQLYAY